MDTDTDTLHLNTPLGVVGTSQDPNEKGHSVFSVIHDTGDLTLEIFVTPFNLRSYPVAPVHYRKLVVSVPPTPMTLPVVSVSSSDFSH